MARGRENKLFSGLPHFGTREAWDANLKSLLETADAAIIKKIYARTHSMGKAYVSPRSFMIST